MSEAFIDQAGKEAGEEALEQAGVEAMEQASKEAAEAVSNVAAQLADGTAKNSEQMLSLIKSEGSIVNKNEIEETMNNILTETAPNVTSKITERVTQDVENATQDATEAAEKARAEKLSDGGSPEEAEQAAEEAATKSFKNPKFNYGKLSGVIFKFSAFAAVAIFMLKGFFDKLDKPFSVTKIESASGEITFTICSDGQHFSQNDSFTFSEFTGLYVSLNGNTITLTENCGPSTIKIKASEFILDPIPTPPSTTTDCNTNKLGIMTCSPDLASNLLGTTGEVLDDLIDAAAAAAKRASDDLGITGFLGSFKWIIIVVAIVFVVILVFWIYKQFKR